MQELTQIVKCLTLAERRFLRSYYNDYLEHQEVHRLTLFELIDKNEVKSDVEAARKIYGKRPDSAFSHLKRRLREDLLRIMVMQQKYNNDWPFRKAAFECRRMMIEGDLLLQRGASKAAVSNLKKAAVKAEEFELPLEQIMIEDLLRTHLGFNEGPKVYEQYTDSIQHNLDLIQQIIQAKEYHNRISLPNVFKKGQEQAYREYAEKAFNSLREIYEATNSPNIGYLYYYTGLYFHEIEGNKKEILDYADMLLGLVEKEKAIQSRTRIAIAHLQIANAHLSLRQYIMAASYAAVAAEQFKDGLNNELTALELQFIASFNAQDLSQAKQTLERGLAHPRRKGREFSNAKWLYYQAGHALQEGKLELAYDSLFENTYLTRDKSGWLFGHKLLEIMIYIERKDYGLIDFRIEALRKLLQRQKDKNIIRIKTISQILYSFVKFDYDFEITYQEQQDRFKLLTEELEDHDWDPMGFEIVRFDKWFAQKVAAPAN